MITIALDVMGGDNYPDCNIDGAAAALRENRDFRLILVGAEDLISEKISNWDEDLRTRVEISNATEIITTEETPVAAVRKKKNSSIRIGAELVRNKKAEAFVSAGSSGALLAAGQLYIGRIKGVKRAALASLIPTKTGPVFFLDMGANVDAKPEWLCQFALMATVYMRALEHKETPTVRLVNLGVEEEKGNALTKAANEMLKNMPEINYQGFIESRDVIMGGCDIILTDADTGNTIIKTMEGTLDFVMYTLKGVLKSSLKTKIGAMFIMKPLKAKLKEFSASELGAAMLLGLNGLVLKSHGNAGERDIKNAILKAVSISRENTVEKMEEAFANLTVVD